MKKMILTLLLATALGFASFGRADADDSANNVGDRLDHKGDRIERRLDRRGDRIENHLDNRGDRIENRLDRRGISGAAG